MGAFAGELVRSTLDSSSAKGWATVLKDIATCAGGFAGSVAHESHITNTSAQVGVSGNSQYKSYSAGFASWIRNATLTSCSASGNMTGAERSGDFAGAIKIKENALISPGIVLTLCSATGNVSAVAQAGGFAVSAEGDETAPSVSITKSYGTSRKVSATVRKVTGGTFASGFAVDINKGVTIEQGYANTPITGGLSRTGFAYSIATGATVKDSHELQQGTFSFAVIEDGDIINSTLETASELNSQIDALGK